MYGVTVQAEIGMSSSSLGTTSDSGGDSFNGLKFGQKIYFEDVGGGGSASAAIPPTGSSSSSADVVVVASPVRKGRGAFQVALPPRCLVECCNVDLTGAKAYYCRHKVCGMHSKAPMVIVAGLEQRFCQQCSRFHQLPEFDQCKRSCRRRLAGHNKRRRKPPPGSLVPPRFPQDTNMVGTFLDFSYSRIQDRDVWPGVQLTEHTPSSQVTTGKYLPDLFQGARDLSPTNVVGHAAETYLQAPSAATIYPGTDFSTGETFAGISGSGCALSLLSNQQWDPSNRSSINNLVDENRAHTSQTASRTPVSTQFISNACGFKDYGDGIGSSSYHLSLHQILDPAGPHFHASSRQYTEPGQPRGLESSSHQMNWSL